MDALTKEEREVADWVRATSASKALKWSQEPGEWINRAELLLETVDRLCAHLALAERVVEAAHELLERLDEFVSIERTEQQRILKDRLRDYDAGKGTP